MLCSQTPPVLQRPLMQRMGPNRGAQWCLFKDKTDTFVARMKAQICHLRSDAFKLTAVSSNAACAAADRGPVVLPVTQGQQHFTLLHDPGFSPELLGASCSGCTQLAQSTGNQVNTLSLPESRVPVATGFPGGSTYTHHA